MGCVASRSVAKATGKAQLPPKSRTAGNQTAGAGGAAATDTHASGGSSRRESPGDSGETTRTLTAATTAATAAPQPPTSAVTAASGFPDDTAGRIRKDVPITDYYDIAEESCLGTGISGAVRVGKHKLTGKRYAIKTLGLKGVSVKRAAMLRNEVSIYLKLDHPNIAKLIEVYETADAIRLVMELCTGGELYDRLAKRKKYSEYDAVAVTRQMLEAISYCHQHRICHRDLKLENWVYADDSDDAPLKLIDFGFSRIFHPGVPMTAMHGTVYYVSPEVMEGCYQETCDVWSIGVIVFMLLSGAPPFNGTHDHQILLKIKKGQYSFSGPRWAGISDLAKDFISTLLQKDANDRPSASEALKHPWLRLKRDEQSASREISQEVVAEMRNFALSTSKAAFQAPPVTYYQHPPLPHAAAAAVDGEDNDGIVVTEAMKTRLTR